MLHTQGSLPPHPQRSSQSESPALPQRHPRSAAAVIERLPVRRQRQSGGRYVHGLVSLFQRGDTAFRRTRYTAVVEPTLKRFDLRSNWRIFQAQTVPDIITNVLAGQKLTDIRSEICFEHQPREYCVQAGETDLYFIARLAAEEGLLYTFEHRADGHTLILSDRVGGLGTIGIHTDCPVIYQAMGGGDSGARWPSRVWVSNW
ncbi:contractile injection system protein, VgrG/Pvc8 family [Pseudomonas sp. SWRI81]|uniref:contractile injection system protein, VgrG/Pvc8 family n=1 Tax=Pseudomonas sp. SWRI81 TaxID=2745505 RepID=UPI003211BEFA